MFDVILGVGIGIGLCIWFPTLPTRVHAKVVELAGKLTGDKKPTDKQ